MFLYGSSFGDTPTFSPSYDDTAAQEKAADALWNTTRDLATYRDNSDAEYAATAEAYERRNKAIFDATGVQLENPMTVTDVFALMQPNGGKRPMYDAGTTIERQRQAWLEKAQALSREKPQFADVIAADRPIGDDATAVARGAETAAAEASQQAAKAGVGTFTRLKSTLGGGLAGALRDPLQVATLAVGGGISSPAKTLGWRMVQTMLTEAAINGGVEGAIQAASQDWKQRAGLDTSLGNSLEQVGLAALFGGGFGGLVQGGHEIFRALGRAVPEEALARAANGEAGEGDMQALADALGQKLDPDTARMAAMAAEQPELDRAAFGPAPAGLDPEAADEMAVQALRGMEAPEDVRAADLERIVRQQMPVGPAPKRPVSLMQFLASREVGGIRDESGELAAMDLSRKFVPGYGALVRGKGKRLDMAREAAAEAGYFDHIYGDPDRATAESTPRDLLDALRQEAGGEPVYSARADGGRQFEWLDYEKRLVAQDAYRNLLSEIDSEAASLELPKVPDSIMMRAAELVDDETDPALALEKALDEDYRLNDGADAGLGELPDAEFEIPFFAERQDAGAMHPGGGAPGEPGALGEFPGERGALAPDGRQLPDTGGDEAETGVSLRQPGATPEPATPEAGDLAELALTEARKPGDSEVTDAGEQTLLEGVKPVSQKEKLEKQAEKPLLGGDKALPEGGLFDLESRKQISIWDAMPAAKDADGATLHTTHADMIADAERSDFLGDLVASCRD